MTNPYIIFKPEEGKLVAEAVDLPNEKDFSGDQWKENQAYQQALANGIRFKEEKDVEEILFFIQAEQWKIKPSNWQPEYNKPYKLPTILEIEIKSEMIPRLKINELTEGAVIQQFAFLKQSKEQEDVFNGSAELDTPEECIAKITNQQEKEDSQDDLWLEIKSLIDKAECDKSNHGWTHWSHVLQSKFTIQRK